MCQMRKADLNRPSCTKSRRRKREISDSLILTSYILSKRVLKLQKVFFSQAILNIDNAVVLPHALRLYT